MFASVHQLFDLFHIGQINRKYWPLAQSRAGSLYTALVFFDNSFSEWNQFGSSYKINYLELPLLAKLQLGNNGGEGVGIHIAAGPWLGYALGGKTKTATTIGSSQEVITERKFTFNDEDDARRINYGLVGAAGIGFGKVTIDLRYNYGLNNILDNDADNTNDNRPVLQTRGVALTMALRL